MGIIDFIRENHKPQKTEGGPEKDDFDEFLTDAFRLGKPLKYFWYGGVHYRRNKDGMFEPYDPEEENNSEEQDT